MAYSSSRGTAGVVSGPLFYPRCYPEEFLRGPGQKQIMGCSSEPSNPIFYSGKPAGRLCQVFNCFGNGALILQLMALALLERAKKSWQRIPETETAMASLLSICCLRCTKDTHVHTYTHKHTFEDQCTGSPDRNKEKPTQNRDTRDLRIWLFLSSWEQGSVVLGPAFSLSATFCQRFIFFHGSFVFYPFLFQHHLLPSSPPPPPPLSLCPNPQPRHVCLLQGLPLGHRLFLFILIQNLQ